MNISKHKQLTRLSTGLAYDKVIKDVDRRELRGASIEKNWENYVEVARGLLAVAEVARMAVAEVAIRATLIRNGGDRQSMNWKSVGCKLTVKAFANSIGVKPNTLWLWIRIKQRVFDQLTDKEKAKFKHDDGEKTLKLMGSKGTIDPDRAQETYRSLSSRTKAQRNCDRVIHHMMCVRKVFLKYINNLTERQIEGVRIAILEVLKVIEERKAAKGSVAPDDERYYKKQDEGHGG